MKRRTFIIESEQVIDILTKFLKSQPAEPVLEVTVEEKQKDRTIAQNRLYRLWGGVIADELGWDRKDVYTYCRKEHLMGIYERDDKGHAEMMRSVRKVWTMGMKQDAERMHDYIVDRISTASATVKQFMEYLKEIEKDMAGKGIILPHPEDRYYSAMGIKR